MARTTTAWADDRSSFFGGSSLSPSANTGLGFNLTPMKPGQGSSWPRQPPHFTPYYPYESERSRVCMIYDLNVTEATCERLFNLFCLYGDVRRVKFLASKPGCAMLEMSDHHGVSRAIGILNGVSLFGQSVTVRRSRQERLVPPGKDPAPMENGSPSFQDFCNSPNQRLLNLFLAKYP